MMKKILIILSSLFIFVSCTQMPENNEPTLHKERAFLGNIVDEDDNMVLLLNAEVYITTVNSLYKEDLISKSKEMIKNYHVLLDSHHYYKDDKGNRINNIKVLNDNIDNGPIKVNDIIIEAINESKKLTKLTKGYFNITVGELSDLYSDKLLSYDTTNTDPDANEIAKCINNLINYDELDEYIIVDKENSTIELKSKNNHAYSLNLGAFSKGYILEKVYEELIKYDTSFLITAGSSSIVTYSNIDEDVAWNIAAKEPDSKDSSLLAFNINNGCISTSGDYENYYFLSDGTRRHHILNPYTGYSENNYRAITLISSNACVIDALSTALFSVDNIELRNEIINNIEEEYDLNINYCFVKDGYDLIMNKSFNNIVIESYNSPKISNINIEN